MRQNWRVATALLLLLPSFVCLAQTPEEKGRSIVQEADRRYGGYEDCTARLRMILRNKQGQISDRELRVRMLEVEGDGTRSLCIFDSPADVKGTILLTHTHPHKPDDQWLFLPALERVKRIAAQNKSGSFMGSEFSYEDIATQTLDKYVYAWLRDETCEGQECSVIERRSTDRQNSGYRRQVVWIDKEYLRTWRIEFYDRKDSLLKTLTFAGYEKYEDKFWRPREMTMVNHPTGKSSQLIWSEFAFRTGLTPNDFNQQSLPRIR
ncbi:MAG: outer membrane lipoprotein-sorting protein [Planctomycetes bacterium RBG_13_62_9]|nr:MAG: outer membrane lipoprotein-sorting protein [Planctomycetes bacterium RBG_13_62_9]